MRLFSRSVRIPSPTPGLLVLVVVLAVMMVLAMVVVDNAAA